MLCAAARGRWRCPASPWGAVSSLVNLGGWSKRLTLTLSQGNGPGHPSLRKKSGRSLLVGAAEGEPALRVTTHHRPASRSNTDQRGPESSRSGPGVPRRTDIWAWSAPHETLLLLVNESPQNCSAYERGESRVASPSRYSPSKQRTPKCNSISHFLRFPTTYSYAFWCIYCWNRS